MPSLTPSNKRKSIPCHAMHLDKRRQINAMYKNPQEKEASNNREEEESNRDTDDDDNDGKIRGHLWLLPDKVLATQEL